MRAVFWVAVIPAGLAVLFVLFGVEDRAGGPQAGNARAPVRPRDVSRLGRGFWGVVAIGVMFTLGRFSEAFLVLKASEEGLPLALAPLVLVVMNIVYALGAYPAGALSDMRLRRLHIQPRILNCPGNGRITAGSMVGTSGRPPPAA